MLGANLRLRRLLSDDASLNQRFQIKIRVKPQSSLAAILFAMLAIALLRPPSALAESDRTPSNSLKTHVHAGETLTGKATYYPNRLDGHKTSGGKTFRQNENTAASNKLPLGTESLDRETGQQMLRSQISRTVRVPT
jgi:rare lipoprotein A (peptidoglycan hydrolase)